MKGEWIPDTCNLAMKFRLWYPLEIHQIVISNKERMEPSDPKGDPAYTIAGWEKGYSFKRFWGNCYAMLGDIAKLEGIQQLCHQYYLHNGSIGAIETVARIKKFSVLCSKDT